VNSIIIDGLAFALPLFIIAVGGLYCERSGVTNLALEGFLGAGAFFGAFFVVATAGWFEAGSQIPMYIAFVIAMVGGAIYSLLHALLCIKFKANQVISGVVVNIMAIALTDFLVSQINLSMFGKGSDKFVLSVSDRLSIEGLADIPIIGGFVTNVYPYEIIIIIVAIIAWYVLYKTPFGMHLRACGDNPHAVDAAGGNVAKLRYIAVMISGALSGLGGMCFAYSISANFSTGLYVGYGYLAVAAMIFGNWNITPTLFACLLFGLARSGGYKLVQVLGMPSAFADLIMILPYLLTLLLLIFFSKNNRAPRALGDIYDKGKR